MRSGAHDRSGDSSVDLAGRVLLMQLGLSAALGALFWGVEGPVAAYSALLGGLICVLPNAFLALRLSMPRRNRGAVALLRAAYIGEIGKLTLTALLFGMVFAEVRPLTAGALFAGFITAQLAIFSGFLLRDKVRMVTTGKQNGH